MSDEITCAKVDERINSAAKEIVEANAPFPRESSLETWQEYSDNLESCLNGARDYAWEEVDSWDWMIYTYQGFQVYDCLWSEDKAQAEEEYWDCNETANGLTPYELGAGIAFFALVNMLSQEIEKQCEELQELAQDKIYQLERE